MTDQSAGERERKLKKAEPNRSADRPVALNVGTRNGDFAVAKRYRSRNPIYIIGK